MISLARQVEVAAFGDFESVADGFGYLREQVFHFFSASQVIGVVIHAHAVAVTEQFSGLDAKQDILQLGIIPPHIVHIISCH